MGFISDLIGGRNKFQAKPVTIEQGATAGDTQAALKAQQAIAGQQQGLATQLAAQGGAQNQSDVYNQMGNFGQTLANRAGANNIDFGQAQALGLGVQNAAANAGNANINFNPANQTGQAIGNLGAQAVNRSMDPNLVNYSQANQAGNLAGGMAGLGAQQATNQNLINFNPAQQTQGQAGQFINQMQDTAMGRGFNPAMSAFQQAASQAVQQGAGQIGSTRGINPAMAQRLAAQQAGNMLQQSAGQAATLQAQQAITAQQAGASAATGLAGQQAGMSAQQQAAQAEQQRMAMTGGMGLQQTYGQQAGALTGAQLSQQQLAGQLGMGLMGQQSQNAIAQGQLGLQGQQVAGNLLQGQAGLATNQAQSQAAMQQAYAGMTQQQQQAMAGLSQAQIANLMGQYGTMGQQGLSQQSILQQALANYNAQNVGQNTAMNQVNAGIAQQNANSANAMFGGIMNAAGGAIGLSDERLKKNIHRLEQEIAPGVQAAEWDWRGDGSHAVGAIAQDVEQLYPEAIRNVQGGYKAIDYAQLAWQAAQPFADGGLAEVPNFQLQMPDQTQYTPPQTPMEGAPVSNVADWQKRLGAAFQGLGGGAMSAAGGQFQRAAQAGIPLIAMSPTANMWEGGVAAEQHPWVKNEDAIRGALDHHRVPGKAKVDNDADKNDTVPAMLTPGEVVLPLSIMHSENPGESVKRFVDRLIAKEEADHGFRRVVKAKRGN